MAIWGKSGKTIDPVAVLEAQVESLKEEITFLRKQNERLQEALVAKESPVAYRTMKEDEAALTNTAAPERLDPKLITKFMAQREGALFGEVEDLISALGQLGGVVVEAPPVGDGKEG